MSTKTTTLTPPRSDRQDLPERGAASPAPSTRRPPAPAARPPPVACCRGSRSSTAVTALLQTDAGSYTWAAAAIGSNSAAGYQLASEQPVMPVGGFNGSDPSPTLAQFQQYVADGEIHYLIASGDGGGPGGGTSAGGTDSSAITSWVTSTFTATTVDGVTLYDLSGGVR